MHFDKEPSTLLLEHHLSANTSLTPKRSVTINASRHSSLLKLIVPTVVGEYALAGETPPGWLDYDQEKWEASR